MQLRTSESVVITLGIGNQLEPTAKELYQQAILDYGNQLFRVARSNATDRDNQSEVITVDSSDIRKAIVLTDLARGIRRSKSNSYLKIVASIAGIFTGVTFDLAVGEKHGAGWIVACLICFATLVIAMFTDHNRTGLENY